MYLIVNRVNQLLLVKDKSQRTKLCFGKIPNQCLKRRVDRERERSFMRLSFGDSDLRDPQHSTTYLI